MIIQPISVRLLIVIAASVIYHVAVYFGVQFIEGEPHILGWKMDDKIPLIPGFIYLYISWFIMLFAVPVIVYMFEPEVFARYIAAYIIDLTVSIAVFLLWPTCTERPRLPDRGLSCWILNLTYKGSFKLLNSAPSVHCSVSFLFLIAAIACGSCPLTVRVLICLLSILIATSTQFVKQHVLVDLMTAIPVAVISWLIAGLLSASGILKLLGL